jgi:hypothetical protein
VTGTARRVRASVRSNPRDGDLQTVRRLLAIFIVTLFLAACGTGAGDDPVTDVGTTPGPAAGTQADGVLVVESGATASGPGISVGDALEQVGSDQPLLVNGSLFVDGDGAALLCEAIAESFPPQCGGLRLEVRGLDPDGQVLEEANGVRWAESVQLLGRVVEAD